MTLSFRKPEGHLRHSRWLIGSMLIVLVVLGTWAQFSDIDQIARAQGQVIASSRTQVIQSANDGVIEVLLVREGQTVRKGDVLARLDRSQAEAALEDSLAKVAALKAALVRLQAEVLGRPLIFPTEIRGYSAFITNQTELYQRRRNALQAELAALNESLRLAREELKLNEPLLVTGDVGQIDIIRLQRQIAELGGQITNRRNKYFQDAQAEMTKTEEDLASQTQMLAERTSVFERTEILAPNDGIVKNIQMTTPGAKVRPGDVIMELLPTEGGLVIEAKLKPSDIAFVKVGLPAAIKLDAFDYSIYGVLHGSVVYVSPDSLSDKGPSGEQVYYRVHVRIDNSASLNMNARSNGKIVVVQPGMTATVEIQTGKRSVFSYITKPVTKTLSESLGER